MRYESYEQQPETSCECDNSYARADGNKRCGAPAFKMYNGRYMCKGHYEIFQQKEESLVHSREDARQWEARVQIKRKNDGKDWARLIIARHEAGKNVPSIALNMAMDVIGQRKEAA